MRCVLTALTRASDQMRLLIEVVEERMMEPKFKLITSSSVDTFEERLERFVTSLDTDDIIVDIKFSTAVAVQNVEYSALVYYQQTESWSD